MRRAFLFVLACCAVSVSGQERPAPTRIEILPGIYVFSTPRYGDVGLDGNSIAITSRDGVLVFDTNGTPAAAAAVLGQIRSITDRPVRYVVNSHWHWDHWYGTESYVRAFPDVRVVAHEKTRELMAGPAIEFNRPGLERDLPGYVAGVEQRAATDASLKALAAEDRFFLDQKRGARLVVPNLTFTGALTIDLGERHIEVLNYGRGVTPGDAFVYLPRERVLLLGDLIVNPITFALACYPSEWVQVLERIDRLDAEVIVTGHGAPLHDKALLHATLDVFRTLLREGKAAKARGLSADQAKEAILPGLREPMTRITNDDPRLNADFKVQLVDWYLHRVYDELDGALTDAIAPVPRS
ncbi:MAG TPA: MBL fold metallo-hydrolase [Vicinamibacterales bacterium]|nr:MBL fold metallo-hydrolase [Vicinamibacterales bacterium]